MFTIKQYDTAPSLEVVLLDHLGVAVNLTGCDITFSMRSRDDSSLVVDGPALILEALNGKVVYEFASGDTNTSGAFYGEMRVRYPNLSFETFPNAEYININIVKAAGLIPA